MRTDYVPGTGLAVIVDGCVTLLPDGCPAALLNDLWTSMLSRATLTDHLQVLLGPGLAAAPPFAMVMLENGAAHVIVRGGARVEVAAAGATRVVAAAHVQTWAEAIVPDATAVRVVGGAATPAAVPLPVSVAIVPASAVRVVVSGASGGLSAAVPTAPPARASVPEPSAWPARLPVAVTAPESESERSVEHPVAGSPVVPAAEPEGSSPVVQVPEPEPVPAVPSVGDQGVEDAELDDAGFDDEYDDVGEMVAAVPVWEPIRSVQVEAPVAPVAPADPVPRSPQPEGLGTSSARRSSEDHDGLTVLSSDVVALRRQLPDWAGDAVPQLSVPTPHTRAPAKLLMSTGLVVSLNRPVLVGRAPQVTRVTNNEIPRLITVASPNQDISRTHCEARMDGDDVVVTDLRSTNGVLLLRQGQGAQRLHPGEPTVVEPGVVVDLGEGVTFLVEAGG